VLDTTKPVLHPAALAVCHFYVRTPAGDGQFTYEPITLDSASGDGRLRTAHPPLPGDLILLSDSHSKKGGIFRVLERCWYHASYLSTYWPVLEPLPVEGPGMDIIVEPAEGLFRDEAPSADEDDEDPA
jgi:hypothetical protein